MLKITENFLKALINATPNAVYLKDKNGKYLMINEKGAQTVGLTVKDFIGKDDKEIFPEEIAEKVMQIDRNVFNGQNHNGEEKVNEDLYFYSHKFIIEDEESGEKVLAGISTDISELKISENELLEARRKAEEANSHKSTFLQNMSHELRTPLNAIIGFSSILSGESGVKDDKIKENVAEYAQLINSSGIHLLEIINDLLDLSKIGAGEQEFFESEIDVKYVIETCIQTSASLAKQNNIIIEENFPEQEVTLKGDEKILRQMIYNLLSNAIKYSCKDSIVTVGLKVRNSGGLDISVIDKGMGMSEEDLLTAMIPFRRTSQFKNSDISGTGLGLPLVDAFIKLFNGMLNIKSTVGEGTRATLHFPPARSILGDNYF
ncbi:MAG: PAS domain S-box protein [Emcibacteraceae bacterium]|nr:PAS domain S-box protein [Emcibacteraceae bacterium]